MIHYTKNRSWSVYGRLACAFSVVLMGAAARVASGSPLDDDSSCPHEHDWVEVQTLDADEPIARQALAIQGDTLVTGGNGQVRVYERSHGGLWTLVQTLAPAAGVPAGAFGEGLALDGRTLVIGAGRGNASGTAFPFGYADVYRRDRGQWIFEARLQPNPGAPLACQESAFGNNVGLDGDLAVVSAERMSLFAGGCGQGATFVFQRSGGAWAQVQVLSGPQVPISNPPAGYPNFDTNFGDSMSLSGGTLVIGQPGRASVPRLQGALFVFVRAGSSFALQQAFVAPGESFDTGDGLGIEVAVHGHTLAVVENGNLRTFVRHHDNWSPGTQISASTPPFGSHSLARSDRTLFLSETGALQVFDVDGHGDLAVLPPLTVDGVQTGSAIAADHDTMAVSGNNGVHVFRR
jgi:hypothetical protein